MITLPADFDLVQLFSDFYTLAAPFVSIGLLIASAMIINRLFKRIP